MFPSNEIEAATLERGMKANQDSIPVDQWCEKCNGKGHVVIGCAFTYSLYDVCFECLGSGRKHDAGKAPL